MKVKMIILSLIASSLLLHAHAQEPPRQQNARRLEYIHFDAVNRSVEWAVSDGMINAEGDFAPLDTPIAMYSINLRTSGMQHGTDNGQMSPSDSSAASRVFEALSLLVQRYTDQWDGVNDPDQVNSEENQPTPQLFRIAMPLLVGPRRSSTTDANRAIGIIVKQEDALRDSFLKVNGSCTEWEIFPGLKSFPASVASFTPPSGVL